MNDPRITERPWPRCLPRLVRPLAYPPMAIFETGLLLLAFFSVLLNRELAARIVRFAETLPDPRDYSWSNVKGHSLDTGSAATEGEYETESGKSIDSQRVSS